jgi:hypothetical protein
MYTKQEEYYLGLVALMEHLKGGVKGELNVVLTPSQSRFLLGLLMREKNRFTGPTPAGSPNFGRLVEKAISTAEKAIESLGKDFDNE